MHTGDLAELHMHILNNSIQVGRTMIVHSTIANYMYVASSAGLCMVSALRKQTSYVLNSKYQILAKLAATSERLTVQAEMKLSEIVLGILPYRNEFIAAHLSHREIHSIATSHETSHASNAKTNPCVAGITLRGIVGKELRLWAHFTSHC